MISPSKYWQGLKTDYQLVKDVFGGSQRCIITPEEGEYYRQFETRISLTGDVTIFLPKYKYYDSEKDWQRMALLHKKRVDAYMAAEFQLLDRFHLLLTTLVSSFIFMITTVVQWIRSGDWLNAVIAFVLPMIIGFVLKKWIMPLIPKVITWWVLNHTDVGKSVKPYYNSLSAST